MTLRGIIKRVRDLHKSTIVANTLGTYNIVQPNVAVTREIGEEEKLAFLCVLVEREET